MARVVAMSGEGVGGRNGDNFRIGCVIADGSSVLAAGVNSYRTSMSLSRFYVYPFYHAESCAINRCGLGVCSGCDLYVARVLKDNSLALARPCDECLRFIEYANIRRIYYSTRDGYVRY